MSEPTASAVAPSASRDSSGNGSSNWETPTVEVISLDCEISSYAPDEDDTPLF